MLSGIHGNAFLSDTNGAVNSVVNDRTLSINWALQKNDFHHGSILTKLLLQCIHTKAF